MKILFSILILLSGNFIDYLYTPSYSSDLVNISITDDEVVTVNMSRKGGLIKAKYFAATDYNGNNVYQRYREWSQGKNIICVTSGTYMDNCDSYTKNTPVGLTIDNGVLVNKTFLNKFDGLVIVYGTGGIVVSNLEEENLSMMCNGAYTKFNLKSSYDRSQFITCASNVDATVFQTHLLVYKDDYKIYWNSNSAKAARRFLSVGKDYNGEIRHIIVQLPNEISLFESTKKVYEILTDLEDMQEIIFMINLDTGCQNIFILYDSQGNLMETPKLTGTVSISEAANLLVYYYD
jgi:hypothetical protein